MKALKLKLEILLTIVCLLMVYGYVNKQGGADVPSQIGPMANIDQTQFMAMVDQAKQGELPREAISQVKLSNPEAFKHVEKELASLDF